MADPLMAAGHPDPSDLTVDALTLAILLLSEHGHISEAWTLYGLSDEPRRLQMRLRRDITVTGPQSPPSTHSRPMPPPQDAPSAGTPPINPDAPTTPGPDPDEK